MRFQGLRADLQYVSIDTVWKRLILCWNNCIPRNWNPDLEMRLERLRKIENQTNRIQGEFKWQKGNCSIIRLVGYLIIKEVRVKYIFII